MSLHWYVWYASTSWLPFAAPSVARQADRINYLESLRWYSFLSYVRTPRPLVMGTTSLRLKSSLSTVTAKSGASPINAHLRTKAFGRRHRGFRGALVELVPDCCSFSRRKVDFSWCKSYVLTNISPNFPLHPHSRSEVSIFALFLKLGIRFRGCNRVMASSHSVSESRRQTKSVVGPRDLLIRRWQVHHLNTIDLPTPGSSDVARIRNWDGESL